MKTTNYLKSLLIAVALLMGGSSAWADETTIYSKALSDWSAEDVTKTAGTVNKWYNAIGIVANDYLTGMMIDTQKGLRLTARQTTSTATLTLNRTKNTIITIDAVWNTGSESYPNNANCNSFIYGDFEFAFYTRYKTTQYKINGVTTTVTSATADEDISIHLIVNTLTGDVKELLVYKVEDPTVVYAKFEDLTENNKSFSNDVDFESVTVKSVNSVSKNYNYTYLKSLTVTESPIGETSTIFEYGTSDVAWSTDNLVEWTAGGNPTISEDGSYVTISGGNGSYSTSKTLSPTKNATINVKAVWRGCSNTGRAFDKGNGSYFRFGNIVVAQNDQNQKHGYTLSGLSEIASVTTFSAGKYRTSIEDMPWLLIEMEINTATNTLTKLSVKSEDGNTTYVEVKDVLLSDVDYGIVAFGYKKEGGVNTTNTEQLKLVKITQREQILELADYKINYLCGDFIVEEEVTRTGIVGNPVSLTDNDKSNVTIGEQRYIYVSDDAEGKTITDGNSLVVTVLFRQAEKWYYSVGSVYENTSLSYSYEGWVWEDQNTPSVPYPRYQAVGRQLVSKGPNKDNDLREALTITEDGYVANLTYSAVESVDNLYLLAEAENLGTNCSTSPTTYSSRVSGKQMIFGASGTLITLPAGKYKFTLGVVGKPNSGTCIYNVSAGENVIITDLASGGNYLTQGTSNEFELTVPTPITFTCSNPSSDRGIDLIYIQKTDQMPEKEEINVTAAGYATLASNYALDLSGMENIYTANVADGIVNFSQNNGKVLPGTGLLIKAPQGKVEIPIVSEAAAVTDNALVGVLADTKLDAGIFVLMNGDEGVGFYKATNEAGFTVRANSAYLPASVAGARFIGLDATATGISDASRLMNNEKMKKEMYNLQGQRVAGAQPKKGLYIKEGRKVIIK